MRNYVIALYKQSQSNPSEDALSKLTDLSRTEEQLRYWAQKQLFRAGIRTYPPRFWNQARTSATSEKSRTASLYPIQATRQYS